MRYSSKHISAHVSRFVDSNDTTKGAVANRLGISRTTLYEKLSGASRWSLDEAIGLADIMECDLTDILVPPKS